MLHLLKKGKWQWNILVPREIKYPDVWFSIVFLFHPSSKVREIDLSSSGQRYFKSCVLVSAQVCLSFICSRKTNSTKKDVFFKEPKKAFALAGLDTCASGLMFLMSFIFWTSWVHRVHSVSTTLVLRKGQKVYILHDVLNFQRVRDPLGLQLRSCHNALFFI